MKLRGKLLAILLPLILAPLLATAWQAFTQLRDNTHAQAHTEMDRALDGVAVTWGQLGATARANSVLLARSRIVERYAASEDVTERYVLLHPALLATFRDYQNAFPDYLELRLLTPDGDEEARTTRGRVVNRAESSADQPWFREVVADPQDQHEAVARNPDNGKPAYYIYHRLRDKKGTVRAYLALTVSLDALATLADSIHIGKHGWITVVNAAGEPILSRDTATVRDALAAEPLWKAGLPDARAPLEGEHLILKTRPIAKGLRALVALPRAELTRPLDILTFKAMLITLLCLATAAAVLTLTLHFILTRPLRVLHAATREIGRGVLQPSIALQGNDELGELGRAVREMGDKLALSQNRIEQLALHDPLTGLPNRKSFQMELERALDRARREQQLLAVLFLDLDNFKYINDSYGHESGDAMLCALAQRLGNALRGGDRVCKSTTTRQGGDEFLILIEDIRSAEDAGNTAGRLLLTLREPFSVEGHALHVTGSIGITVYPNDGDDYATLIRNADLAMYQAKQAGKNTSHFFTATLNEKMSRRTHIAQRLRCALDEDSLKLVYQPQFDCKTRRMVGCEALLRWEDAELGSVSPVEFIPVAEDTGLIIEIGDWVLKTACQQNVRWQAQGLAPIVVAVNLSSVQIRQGMAVEAIAAALTRSGLSAQYLDVEITESVLMDNGAESIALLERIKDLDVRLSLDDFGTGYSSLSYLCRFPLDCLKIDRSFVNGINQDSGQQAIVSAILSLSNSLGLHVIAEGVETEEQLRFLTALGCDTVQGYLLGRPMSAEALARLLAEQDDNVKALVG